MGNNMIKKTLLKPILLSLCIFLLLGTIKVDAHHREPAKIKILETNTEFTIESENNQGGMSIAAGDLGTDGTPEIIIGSGLGQKPYVKVLRQDGSMIGKFLAYEEDMWSGIHVAVCDLTGDGINEIVTSAGPGGGPHIRIFSNMGKLIDGGNFMAYSEKFQGGVNLACGKLNSETKASLVTLPETTGGPHVRVWNISNKKINLEKEFFAFDKKNKNGLVGTISNKKLFLGEQKNKKPTFKTYVIHNEEKLLDEKQIEINSTGINSLFVKNNELHFSSTTNRFIQNVVTGKVQNLNTTFDTIATNLSSNNNEANKTLIAQSKPSLSSDTPIKKIIVNTSEQRLYAYENGLIKNTFLVSSSLKDGITPIGNHKILAKLPVVHYAWFYGSGSPDNYDLGWVPFNLRFYPHIYIHYAPWHNNFGHRMSHGCVNVSLENMKWIYGWADVGTEVQVIK
jgi:lipoprotein-anchoring transpeptidase ErfK/SrfK